MCIICWMNEQLQKIHDKYIRIIDDLLAAKTKEIMTV